jgi:hypothetical protein
MPTDPALWVSADWRIASGEERSGEEEG